MELLISEFEKLIKNRRGGILRSGESLGNQLEARSRIADEDAWIRGSV